MKKLLLLSLLVLFGCTKDDESTNTPEVNFLEKFDKTSWVATVPFPTDWNNDGIEDKIIYSFLNTSNLSDVIFWRGIWQGATYEDIDVMDGYCTNLGYPSNYFTCPGSQKTFDRNTYEIVNHTSNSFEIKKSWWVCNDNGEVIAEDSNEDGISDFTLYRFSYNSNTKKIRRTLTTEESDDIKSSQLLTQINLTWRENYDRCDYINRRFRGRY